MIIRELTMKPNYAYINNIVRLAAVHLLGWLKIVLRQDQNNIDGQYLQEYRGNDYHREMIMSRTNYNK